MNGVDVRQFRHAAVVGSPISHSLSPIVHRAAYQALNIDWSYEAIEQTKESFPEFVHNRPASWRGLSITMPLKEVALLISDSASDLAVSVGAANTLIHDGATWHAENTDVGGMVTCFAERGVTTCNRATLLGGGATARSAFAALVTMGVDEVTLCVRRAESGAEFVEWAAQWDVSVRVATMEPVAEFASADVVISSVPHDAADAWAAVAGEGALLDVSYHPWPTVLARSWRGSVSSGRDLLLWQAVEQVHLMTGLVAPIDAMRSALNSA